MIFVFIEDGTLDVIGSQADALREYEGVDVENAVFKFYDENGVYLKPIFTTPNKYRNGFFGLFQSVESGIFTLELAPNESEDSIEVMLHETSILNPNEFFDSLDEIRKKFNVLAR